MGVYKEKMISHINKDIQELKKNGRSAQEVTDGYHTFRELYYHRMKLFSIICNTYKDAAWKSWLHDDGTMFDGMFVVGITTPEGNYAYHYDVEHWDEFDVEILENAPVYDGHKPEDIGRLDWLVEK